MSVITTLRKIFLLLIVLIILPNSMIKAQESKKDESPKNNALNLLPTYASLVTTIITLTDQNGVGDLFLFGIGYERKIINRFSIFGSGIVMVYLEPFSIPWMELTLAGRYYFNKPLRGAYTGLSIDYSEFDSRPIFWGREIGVKAVAGYKRKIGPFYVEPEIGLGVGFGKIEMDFLGLQLFNFDDAMVIPAVRLNAGIVF
jgi:hypothetical protein